MFAASPHDVFEALMDSKKHSAFTQSKAVVNRKVGGNVTAYDGYISAQNVKLVKDKKIVQQWGCKDWPKGHYSTAVFDLKKAGGKTQLTFTQTGVPEAHFESIAQGWKDHYWTPLKEFLEK